MTASRVLGLKRLASGIHPPLTLTSRDSKKLLSLLNDSFRQHLDREHPSGVTAEASYTDHHFRSILASPLFNTPQKKKSSNEATRNHKNGHALVHAMEGVQGLTQAPSPLEAFVEHVAAGTATISIAKSCLVAQQRKISALPNDQQRQEYRTSQCGAKMLSWLWSSGMESTLEFCTDPRFIDLLMPLLVVEGREAVVYGWLRLLRLKIGDRPLRDAGNPRQFDTDHHLLKSLILSKIGWGGGLETAMEAFITVVADNSDRSQPLLNYSRRVFGPAGRKIIAQITQNKAPSVLSISCFTKFVDTIPYWSPIESYYKALLLLHDPSGPDASSAVQYIRHVEPEQLKIMNTSTRNRMVLLCIDAAQVLFSEKNEIDAMFVMSFLQNHFADEIYAQHPDARRWGRMSPRAAAQVEDESFMRQLDNLAIG